MKTEAVAKNNLAISYTRFSSMAQAAGDSERRQTEAAQLYCAKHGLTLTDKYRLQDSGKSAYKGNHRSATSALGHFEKQVAEGKIPTGTVLIVESLDRLSREDIVKAQLLMLNLIDKGIEIVALADNERVYNYESVTRNPTDLIMSIVILSRAHDESDKKSYRAKQNWMVKKKLAAQGKFIKTSLPGWLVYKDDKYIAVPEKVEVIKKVFALYLKGYGVMTISKMLGANKEVIVAKGQKGKRLHWHPNYVTRLLKSRELIGYYTKTKPEVPSFFPAVISISDFYAVQAKLKERICYKGQRNNNPFVFSHIMKCTICGEAITRNTMSPKYCYLRCYGSVIGKCRAINISSPEVEKALLNVISVTDYESVVSGDDVLSKITKEADTLKGRVAEIDNKITVSTKLFLTNPSEAGSKIMQQLEAERNELNNQLEEQYSVKFLIDHRKDWRQVKAMLEAKLTPDDLSGEDAKYNVAVPYSVVEIGKGRNKRTEYILHEEGESKGDVIALRESLRIYISRIMLDISKATAEIHFKSGVIVSVWFKKTQSHPRRYFYRTINTDWQEIKTS